MATPPPAETAMMEWSSTGAVLGGRADYNKKYKFLKGHAGSTGTARPWEPRRKRRRRYAPTAAATIATATMTAATIATATTTATATSWATAP